MSSPDSTPIYSERKPFVALVSTALAFGIGIVAAVKYGHYWIAVAILVLYLLGVSHTTLSVRVSASDVVVRSLTNTRQYYLYEITDVKISSGVAPDFRLVFPQEIVKISGFSNTQVRNLRKAILTAREHATPEV